MKVYISIDAEGCSGIFKLAHVCSEHRDYDFCRRMMEGDANAAIRGAYDAGATEVLVCDAHDNSDNIRIENLDPRARLISGGATPLSMMEGITGDFDAALLLGYHSRKGERGSIAHTYSFSSIREVRINGRPVSEAEISGYLAGHFGVPVVFLSGDQYITEHMRSAVPGLRTVTTKRAIGCSAAECVHPTATWKQIQEEVSAALAPLVTDPIKPMGDAPYTIEIDFGSTSRANLAMRLPGAYLAAPATTRYRAEDYMTIYNAFLCMVTLSSSFSERK